MMSAIAWQHKGNDFQVSLLEYKAIITESSDQQTYNVRIESSEGATLRRAIESFNSFAEAEAWALFVVVDLEQMGDRAIAQKRMLETIDYCQSLLPVSIHASHIERLNHLREWIVSQCHYEELGQLSAVQHSSHLLKWIETDPGTYTAETPHGQAILHEERAKKPFAFATSSCYSILIRHISGATYKCPETFMDFIEAENWLKQALQKLDNPQIAEYYLDNIHFTLAICQHALPSTSELLHTERLEYLNMLLDDALL